MPTTDGTPHVQSTGISGDALSFHPLPTPDELALYPRREAAFGKDAPFVLIARDLLDALLDAFEAMGQTFLHPDRFIDQVGDSVVSQTCKVCLRGSASGHLVHARSCLVGQALKLIGETRVACTSKADLLGCPWCGPRCLGGAAHHARREDGVLYGSLSDEGSAPVAVEAAERTLVCGKWLGGYGPDITCDNPIGCAGYPHHSNASGLEWSDPPAVAR